MHARLSIAACMVAAAAAAAGAAYSQTGVGATFMVRNDTNKLLDCAIRKAGSSYSEPVLLKPGEQWTRSYPKLKARNFRCLGAAPVWYTVQPGLRYRLAPNQDGLIVLSLAGR